MHKELKTVWENKLSSRLCNRSLIQQRLYPILSFILSLFQCDCKKLTEKRRNSPVGERHALEKLVQGRFDAQLLGGAPDVRQTAARESVVKKAGRCDDREASGLRLLLIRHRHSEIVLIILRFGLKVRHHKVARVYRLAWVPPAILLPFVIVAGAMKTALARHRRLSIYQFRLHLRSSANTRLVPSNLNTLVCLPRAFSIDFRNETSWDSKSGSSWLRDCEIIFIRK